MANTPGGSFIPKRPQSLRSKPVKSGRRVYIFSYVAYILFFGSLLSAGGVYFLKAQAEGQLEEHILLLDAERSSFNQSKIGEIQMLDQHLRVAISVLDQHIAFSKVLEELERFTAAPVQFASLNFARTINGPANLSLEGLTENFDVLLFQREALSASEIFAAADFVNIGYGQAVLPILGTDRANPENPQRFLNSVTFTFENSAFVDKIRYTPGNSTATRRLPPTPVSSVGSSTQSTSSPATEEDDTISTSSQSTEL